jgi:hypothetical protein
MAPIVGARQLAVWVFWAKVATRMLMPVLP